jgi:hypothetical protein
MQEGKPPEGARMKGTILKCLQEMVEARFGKPEWQEILGDAGFKGPQLFSLSADVDEGKALALFASTARVLEISAEQAADAFGDFWVNDYAARVYQTIYARYKSARQFLMAMDGVHVMVTESVANARPPRFEFEEQGEKTLLVTYKSKRGLIDLYIGLVRGVGKRFGTPLGIQKLSPQQVKITFP